MCRSRRFSKGYITLRTILDMDGGVAHYSWCQKTRVIALLCGIKISARHCLVLLQSTRVTDKRTDGQNYDFQDRANIAASRVKRVC